MLAKKEYDFFLFFLGFKTYAFGTHGETGERRHDGTLDKGFLLSGKDCRHRGNCTTLTRSWLYAVENGLSSFNVKQRTDDLNVGRGSQIKEVLKFASFK